MTTDKDSRLENGDRANAIRHRAASNVSRVIRNIAGSAGGLTGPRIWPVVATLIGTLPCALSFATQIPGHAFASAILLSVLCLGFVKQDRWTSCIAAISLTFISHSLLAIALSRSAPQASAAIFPKASDYWQQQRRWITTGINEEYELDSWLPAHAQMFFGIAFFSFTSFGAVVFHDGFVQVDMMNYYNAQLSLESKDPIRAIGFGWHLWSIMRGLGYLFVTYEMISLAYRVFSGERITTVRRRLMRWSAGLSLLVADCVIKYFAVEAVRMRLFENLTS